MTGNVTDVLATEAPLAKLDPAMRRIFLKLPPRVREELLEGLRDEGPAGYERFVREYFRRLTKAK